MPFKARRSTILITWLTSLVAIGCGPADGLERVMVSGEVSYDGQAVEVGRIRFVPLAGTAGPVTIEVIDAGRFVTSTSGGVPVGKHRVEITGHDAEEYANAPVGPGSPPPRQLLPDCYNRKSELEICIESGSGAIAQDYRLSPVPSQED
jgi:hypothetical protein